MIGASSLGIEIVDQRVEAVLVVGAVLTIDEACGRAAIDVSDKSKLPRSRAGRRPFELSVSRQRQHSACPARCSACTPAPSPGIGHDAFRIRGQGNTERLPGDNAVAHVDDGPLKSHLRRSPRRPFELSVSRQR